MLPRLSMLGHTPFRFRTGHSSDALTGILRRSKYNMRRHASQLPSNVYTAKVPTFSGAEARLITHNQTSSRTLLTKNLCHWRCRELVRADPSILAAPVPSLLSRMLPRHALWIIARDGHFSSPDLWEKLKELDLLVEQKYAISNQMLQACYEFTLKARLAPKWIAVKDMLIMGQEFLTTGQAHAVNLDVRLTANEVILGIAVRELSLKFLKLEHLDVDDRSVLNTFLSDPNSVASLSCRGTSCVILPSLKKGYVASVSREPVSFDFPTYDKLRVHWEKQCDIVLPENEDLFYAVGFGRKLTSLYTYPGSCVYRSQPTAVPVEDSRETRVAGTFVEDVHAVMPTVCGESVTYEKGDSTKLNHFSLHRLKESDASESCMSLYPMDFSFDGVSPTVPPGREKSSLAEEGKTPLANHSTVEINHTPESSAAPLKMARVDRAEGRFYHVNVGGTLCDLPSVTTVLRKTMPKQSFFRLLSWRKSMTKEHGSQGYKKIAAETLRRGSAFHQQLEEHLQKSLITPDKEDITPAESIEQPEAHPQKSVITTSDAGEEMTTPTENTKQPEDHPRKSLIAIPDADTIPTESIKQPEDYLQESVITASDAEEEVITHTESSKQPEDRVQKSLIATNAAEIKDILPTESVKQPEKQPQKSLIATNDTEEETITPTEGIEQQLRQSFGNSGYMKSVQHVLEDISEVYALESGLAHPELGYAGTVDCIAKYKDKLCVIDWKTSSTPRPSVSDLFDFPLQVAAYAGAINQDPYFRFKVHNVLIVVAYKTGAPAHPHLLSHQQCLQYWQQWLARLNHYHSTESSGSSVNLT